MKLQKKLERLRGHLEELTKRDICIAFSGGVDSSLLLYLAAEAARDQGTKVYAVTFDTELHPRADVLIAARVAKEAGAIHEIIRIDELKNPDILENPPNRCYLCKKMLFERLLEFAARQGVTQVLEGTNSDDLLVYRPGIQAVRELGVISPLADTDFTKEDVRICAREWGVTVSDRPSTPCLATRLPYNTKIERKLLERIEEGEAYLKEMGLYNLRLRVHKDIVRLEVDSGDFQKCIANRGEITTFLKKLGFTYVTLDLEGFRSGSMDEKHMGL